MNRISVLAMGAAIALTAGLVLVFGLAGPNHQPRTVSLVDALEPELTGAVDETAPTGTLNIPAETDYVAQDSMEILGLGLEITTTTLDGTTTTTTPASPPTTRASSSSPSTTARQTPTTTAAPPATTTTLAGEFRGDLEAAFLAEINAYRASNGLGALQRDSALDNRARNWSKRMSDNNKLSHSNLSNLLPPWSAAGENVGRGGSVSSLMNALINSPGHRANLLGDFTHIGLGVWRSSDGTVWVTQVFTR